MSLASETFRAAAERLRDAVTLVDLTRPDQPLVYVNAHFRQMTGYDEASVLGRNCRFLQGPATDRKDVARLRRAIDADRAIACDLLNYRRDDTIFYNRLVLVPIVLDGRPHVTGMQLDSTSLVTRACAQGQTFDELKMSEEIRDRINTPLMKIALVLEAGGAPDGAPVLERAFAEIAATVRAIPFAKPLLDGPKLVP